MHLYHKPVYWHVIDDDLSRTNKGDMFLILLYWINKKIFHPESASIFYFLTKRFRLFRNWNSTSEIVQVKISVTLYEINYSDEGKITFVSPWQTPRGSWNSFSIILRYSQAYAKKVERVLTWMHPILIFTCNYFN